MSIYVDVRFVEALSFAGDAATVLADAWSHSSALHYNEEYLRWQLSFPGPFPAPAVAAFCENRPVGFAAATHRRVRYQSRVFDALVVSFVAVQSDFRGRGVAHRLYDVLLGRLREFKLPVITFAINGSGGERAISRAYPEAGFILRSIGEYPVYGFVVRPDAAEPKWAVVAGDNLPPGSAPSVSGCYDRLIWSDPDSALLRHYLSDPRGRVYLAPGPKGPVASVVHADFVGAGGVEYVTTIDSVWSTGTDVALLTGLAASASQLWPGKHGNLKVVHFTNLAAFERSSLRSAGFRQISTRFKGYLAVVDSADPLLEATGVNLEIV